MVENNVTMVDYWDEIKQGLTAYGHVESSHRLDDMPGMTTSLSGEHMEQIPRLIGCNNIDLMHIYIVIPLSSSL